MKIELNHIPIRDLVEEYKDDLEEGVIGYNGKLDIRPKYQREFVYSDDKRDKVIDTVSKGFPLNVMYWAKSDNGGLEVLDGQQRTISICRYVKSKFSIDDMYFHNLTAEEQSAILDYELTVYFCEGESKEKLDWFETINIAGEKLTDQELKNAVYSGSWITDAKKYFSKSGCPAYDIAHHYIKGSPIRQDYLETALDWIGGGDIKGYMSVHQHDPNAGELWLYFQSVINWVKTYFPKVKPEMKSVPWGHLYNKYKDKPLDAKTLESEVSKLMEDDDVTRKSGVYSYVLSREEKHLNVRAFSDSMKREVYERQNHSCLRCGEGKTYGIKEMEADHITPWSQGGKTSVDNCQLLCLNHNRTKGAK